MIIRPAKEADWPDQWAMLEPVFRAGTTYAIDRDISEAVARDYWVTTAAGTYVCESAGRIVGTFYIRRNAAGGGAHVCNCGYITDLTARRQGVAQVMCEWSQGEAVRLGFRAMQFNMVLSSNEGALRLWQRLGFETVGIVPDVFDHPEIGLVSGHVMYKALETRL